MLCDVVKVLSPEEQHERLVLEESGYKTNLSRLVPWIPNLDANFFSRVRPVVNTRNHFERSILFSIF